MDDKKVEYVELLDRVNELVKELSNIVYDIKNVENDLYNLCSIHNNKFNNILKNDVDTVISVNDKLKNVIILSIENQIH